MQREGVRGESELRRWTCKCSGCSVEEETKPIFWNPVAPFPADPGQGWSCEPFVQIIRYSSRPVGCVLLCVGQGERE